MPNGRKVVVVYFVLENNGRNAAAGITGDPLRTGLGSLLSRISRRQNTTIAPKIIILILKYASVNVWDFLLLKHVGTRVSN